MSGGNGARAKVSACVITLNEEDNIRECLASLSWVDELVLVDSFSTDKTCDIARELGAKVVQRKWNGINEQRQAALGECANEWVLCLDADERVSPELKDEVLRLLEKPAKDGYLIPRHTKYLGRWINHCGWYPDLKLRLFRKDAGTFRGTDPHDHFVMATEPGELSGEIHHFTYRNFAHQIRTINSFSETASEELVKKGKGFGLLSILFRPPWKFFEVYVMKAGFLDGVPGLIIAGASAFNIFARHAKLWEKTRSR